MPSTKKLICPECGSSNTGSGCYMEGGVSIEHKCKECKHREEIYIGSGDSPESSKMKTDEFELRWSEEEEMTYSDELYLESKGEQ